jgi:hypothetical protein
VREYHSPSSKGSEGKPEGFRSVATSAACRYGPLPGVPREVQASFLLWLTAVGAGVVEMNVRSIYSLSVEPSTGSGLISSVLIRVIVYTVVVYVIAQMRLGKRWPASP